MSVMLSHIDISPQDDVEIELQKEDERQQIELKAFLNEELDDDDLLLDNNSFLTSGGHPKQQNIQNEYQQQQKSEEYPNYINNDVPYSLTNGWHGYSMDQDHEHGVYRNLVQDGDELEYDHQQYSSLSNNNNESTSQLQVLYEARGRKIGKLEKEMEEKLEEMSKENRILNHKLILATGEKEGALTSVSQLQELLQQHETDLKTNEKYLNEERERSSNLEQKVSELTEKLEASEETIDSLHYQIQQMNQSDSLARARAQHESILSTLRQKNEAEVLALKEKMDDLKQALAWKTEDVNRYREMLDSNSTASEMGILQHRLRTEENTTRTLRNEIEQKNKEIKELEEQLRMYNTLMRTDSNQLSSTPYIPPTSKGSLRRAVLDFKTPVSKIQTSTAETPKTPQGTIRNELVSALSSNHERRREINTLREEVARLQHELALKGNKQNVTNVNNHEEKPSGNYCENCAENEKALERLADELQKVHKDLDEAKVLNSELQSNMVDLVKTLDKKKIQDVETQNNAMLKFVDDVKDDLRKELESIHEAEKHALQAEIEKLGVELLDTKEEYVKLCDEMKLYQKQLQDNVKNDSKIEFEELKHNLEQEFDEKLTAKENQLTAKYLEDIARERDEWKREAAADKKHAIEQHITLEKVAWMEEYDKLKEKEIEGAVRMANLKWNERDATRCEEERVKLENWKKEWSDKQNIIFEDKLKAAEINWLSNYEKETKKKLEEETEKMHKEVKENYEKLIEEKSRSLQEQYCHKIKSLEDTISSLKQQLHKAEVTLQLKESTFLRKETDLRYSVKLLQSEIQKLNERLTSDDPNQSQSSLIYNRIVEMSFPKNDTENETVSKLQSKLQEYGVKEEEWLAKEKELRTLLRKTVETSKYYEINEESGTVFPDPSDSLLNRVVSVNTSNDTGKQSQKSSDEERLRNALELSRQKVASLVSSNEQLERRIASLERELETKKAEVKTFEEYKRNLNEDNEKEKALLNEKFAMEIEKIKLVEENTRAKLNNELQLEKEKLRNNLLVEISGQLGDADEVNLLKQKHVKEIRKLKQNFCEKLERISEMKKKWMEEEEKKRMTSEETLKKEFELNIIKITEQNEQELSRQRKHWESIIAKLKEDDSIVVNKLMDEHQSKIKELHEEIELNAMTTEKEKNNLINEITTKQQELNVVHFKHEQLLTKIKSLEEASIFGDSQSNVPNSSTKTNQISSLHTDSQSQMTLTSSKNNPISSIQDKLQLPNLDSTSVEELRTFYLQSIKNIQEDVTSYTRTIKQKCNHEIREAVRRERKEILHKMNQKKEAQVTDIVKNSEQKPTTRESQNIKRSTPPVKETAQVFTIPTRTR